MPVSQEKCHVPSARKLCTQLLVVVGPHAVNLASGIQQHHLGGLAATNIVEVVDDDCLCAPERIDQIETEIG